MAFKFINSILSWSVGLSPRSLHDAKATIAAVIAQPRFSKEHMPKYATALRIARDAYVLKECNEHVGVFVEGNEGIENAYTLGNAQFTAGELTGIFKSRREMMDIIKEVVDDYAGGCDICASARPYR